MFAICRFCAGPGTTGDGPGAPCVACIRRLVGCVMAASSQTASRTIDAAGRRPPQSRQRLGPLLVERLITRPAAEALPDRAVDMVFAVTLPVYAVEIALRLAGRLAARRIRTLLPMHDVAVADRAGAAAG